MERRRRRKTESINGISERYCRVRSWGAVKVRSRILESSQ